MAQSPRESKGNYTVGRAGLGSSRTEKDKQEAVAEHGKKKLKKRSAKKKRRR
jgi:hypothetical protein